MNKSGPRFSKDIENKGFLWRAPSGLPFATNSLKLFEKLDRPQPPSTFSQVSGLIFLRSTFDRDYLARLLYI